MISSVLTRVAQFCLVLAVVFWTTISIILLLVGYNVDLMWMAIYGVVVLASLAWLYLQLVEIEIHEEYLILKKLFSNKRIERTDIKFNSTVLPFVYELTQGDKSFKFLLNESILFRSHFTFDSNYIMDILYKSVKSN